MKINGRVVDKPNHEILVLPRQDGDLVFRFDAVTDESEFFKLCPRPKPPTVTKKGGVVVEDATNPDFLSSLDAWGEKKIAWAFLKSISATDGLEWSTVKAEDPETWNNWKTELTDAGFSTMEKNLLFNSYMEANSLSESRLTEARNRFLAAQAAV